MTSPDEFRHISPKNSSKTYILSLETDNPVTLPSDFQNSKSSPVSSTDLCEIQTSPFISAQTITLPFGDKPKQKSLPVDEMPQQLLYLA